MTDRDAASNLDYDRWLADFLPRARAAGIPEAALAGAFAGAGFMPDVIERDRNQTEFNRTVGQYLSIAASEARVAEGRRRMEGHATLLDAIERTYKVDKEAVAAIWGIETSYGANRGRVPVISALSTLAFEGRRGAFFETQLLAALRILAAGDTTPEALTGSWAGAMGHTQFMPTSFESLAVDFDGDGRRDIWSDDPADALASTAAYLADAGWTFGQPWGVEVVLPPGFDHGLAGRDADRRSTGAWTSLGVRDANGEAVPDHGDAAVLLPAGAAGPAVLTFRNFDAIERYNAAAAYVIGVGHLADRLRGGPPIRAPWPEERAMSFDERVELQGRLTALGFDTQGADGRIGPRTIRAIRAWQRARGEVPDGFPSLALLETLRC